MPPNTTMRCPLRGVGGDPDTFCCVHPAAHWVVEMVSTWLDRPKLPDPPTCTPTQRDAEVARQHQDAG
jgi:hypothetical protein